jgi:hypothetical protein
MTRGTGRSRFGYSDCRSGATAGRSSRRGRRTRIWRRIAWAPHAITANRHLEWRQLDERVAEVATNVGQERVAVQLEFNNRDEIERTIAERPRLEAGNAITGWVGEYREYRELGGTWIHTHDEVR